MSEIHHSLDFVTSLNPLVVQGGKLEYIQEMGTNRKRSVQDYLKLLLNCVIGHTDRGTQQAQFCS